MSVVWDTLYKLRDELDYSHLAGIDCTNGFAHIERLMEQSGWIKPLGDGNYRAMRSFTITKKAVNMPGGPGKPGNLYITWHAELSRPDSDSGLL